MAKITAVSENITSAEDDIMWGVGYLSEKQKRQLADILIRRGNEFADFLNSYEMLTSDDLTIINAVADLLATANRKYISNYNHMYAKNMFRTLRAITDLLSNMTDKDCEYLRFIIGAGFWANNDFNIVESKLNPNY